ncbi:MAG: membrane protein insertion efficiency factor YidD [Gammaproteobacteria bacterium]|nr:membrane protein insertion efficiency factor YidD [Gammaproteobacteria bacterium]
MLALPLLLLVQVYRIAISPFLGANCRFQPTCSEYAVEALKTHGAFRGSKLAVTRIVRCHPWGSSGYDPVPGASDGQVEADPELLAKQRTKVLNHAYGFVSRGNRAGGLEHIYGWLHEDPDPGAAWSWFFEQMMRWENHDAALVYAQRYLGELLLAGREMQAVKLLLRMRLVNESFRPLPEDLELSIAAARKTGNDALGDALRRS